MSGRTTASPRTPVVLVVDTGVDDALALAVAVRHAALRPVGIVATAGNVPLARAVANTRAVLAVLDCPLPVTVGPGARLDGRPFPVRGSHGPDGLGGLGARASAARPDGPASVGDVLRAARGGTVVWCGPLTGLAEALRVDPGVLDGVRVVVTAALPGEPNERMDPLAAREVTRALPLVHHGYARFARTAPAPAALREVPPGDPARRLVGGLLAFQRGRGAGLGDAGAVREVAEAALGPDGTGFSGTADAGSRHPRPAFHRPGPRPPRPPV